MEVQLQTKLALFLPEQPVRRRYFTLRRHVASFASVDDFERAMSDLGWLVWTLHRRDSRVFKMCSECGCSGLARRCFGKTQWPRDDAHRRCLSCTKKAATDEADRKALRMRAAERDFVPPLPRSAAPVSSSPVNSDTTSIGLPSSSNSTAAAVQQQQQQYNSSSSSTAAAAAQQHLQPNVEGTEPLQVYIYRDGEDTPACLHCVAGDPDSGVLERGWGSPQVVMPRVRDRPMPPDLRAPSITKGDMVTAFMQIGIWIRVTCDTCASWWLPRRNLATLARQLELCSEPGIERCCLLCKGN